MPYVKHEWAFHAGDHKDSITLQMNHVNKI